MALSIVPFATTRRAKEHVVTMHGHPNTGDAALREAAQALALLPRHLPWSDTCTRCDGVTFISPDVLRLIHEEALDVVKTTLAARPPDNAPQTTGGVRPEQGADHASD